MTFEYGLLMGVLGMLFTIVGLMIAYIVAYETVKPKPKREPNPTDDLLNTKANRLPDDVL